MNAKVIAIDGEDHARWIFEPVSDSATVGQAGAGSIARSTAPATFYFWTLAMGCILGLIVGFLVWGQ